MSDFTLVDPRGWQYDLQSVYSAYIGYFQLHNIAWYDRTWGHLFSSFDEFLAFSWPVITVTDAWTGRAHIVTRLNSIGAFLKMIKTRFGETLPQAPNILQVSPFESASRHLRHISDGTAYKKLHSTLPAAILAALKTRVRSGEPKAIRELWERRDKTFLAIDFEWSERNEKSCLEWGYAAVRCGHLEALRCWPPQPDANYRKGHYIVAEYVDKVVNKYVPTHPWQYAFGESQITPKSKLPQIIQAIFSSLASPDSETTANNLVLVAHGVSGDLARLEEMKIKLPHNVLIVDTAVFERALFSSGQRPPMVDPKTNKQRLPGSTLSLENLLYSFTLPSPPSTDTSSPDNPPHQPQQLPTCRMHNAGNDALMTLFALQMLFEPHDTVFPTVKKGRIGRPGVGPGLNPTTTGLSPAIAALTPMMTGSHSMMMNGNHPSGSLAVSPLVVPRSMSPYDLAEEFEQMQVRRRKSSLRAPTPQAGGRGSKVGGNNRHSRRLSVTR